MKYFIDKLGHLSNETFYSLCNFLTDGPIFEDKQNIICGTSRRYSNKNFHVILRKMSLKFGFWPIYIVTFKFECQISHTGKEIEM